ncbi:hypothetical protein DP939_42845 [Spongiactinospora rosea]|uniref:Uncharacterized protein n=1 Tax=Spongiactinospora rosea TaxID=2248750 RepID=A0A366LJE9_9ACTN|nr:hypothetical protein [Spongiactinospora rosea]RBQ14018.1 hypothetical protein DP939_42845 [Spongiactinospora rosea]
MTEAEERRRWWSDGEITVELAEAGDPTWLRLVDTCRAGTAVWVSRARWDLFLVQVKSGEFVPDLMIVRSDLVLIDVGDVVPDVVLPLLTTWEHWTTFLVAIQRGEFDHI